jgi:hypothetical protein
LISYPLTIYVTNKVIESIIFGKMAYSELRKWLKNLSRTVVVFLAISIGYNFYYCIHKILGFTAIVVGSWIVLITPSAIHNKLIAKTSLERCFNWFIIIYALLIGIIIGSIIIYTWNDPE